MASNRYGRIYHSESNYINLRFHSVDARREYAEKFQEYHAGHEHDGEVPRFEEITAATIGGFNVWDIPEADSVSIDGYHAYEIQRYHEREDDRYVNYHPPTCCVSPLISIEREFVDSSTLTRHELSAVFGDMPEQDYQSLLESIRSDGIMDEVIRLIGDEVLDGWHRYRAAKELNLIRTLRFQQWDTRDDHDGDPAAFVLARNIERRHLTSGQRAQIVVSFNERFEHGGDRSNVPSGTLKNRKELAEKANVGERTISRAVAVEKAGKSEAVIAGEKSASEVLKEQEAETLLKKKRRKLKALWDARSQACTDYVGEDDTALQHQGLTLEQLQEGFPLSHPAIADAFQSGMERARSGEGFFENFQESVLESDTSLEDLEKECKAISIYAHDISTWQEQDWIQQIIRLKSDRIKAQDANTEMWNAFEKSDLSKHLDKDDLQEVASKALQCPKNFPDPMQMKRPEIWVCWFGAITRTIEQESGWVKELLDKFREDGRLDAAEEPDYEQIQSEHTERLKALPGEIRDYIPKWQEAHAIEGEITLKLLVMARWELVHIIERGPDPFFKEEMEDTLKRMKSNDTALVVKVKEFLKSISEVTSFTEEQSPSNYSLEYLIVAFKDADYKIQPSLSFRVIPSRQMGEHPMTEVPDALKAELLKLIESKKVFTDEDNDV